MDLHPIRLVEFDRALITGQIGCKSTEINWHLKPLHCMPAWSNLVVIISMDLHPIQPVEFDRSVEFDRVLITGQIGCKSTEINWHLKPLHCMPAWSNLVVINYWSNWV